MFSCQIAEQSLDNLVLPIIRHLSLCVNLFIISISLDSFCLNCFSLFGHQLSIHPADLILYLPMSTLTPFSSKYTGKAKRFYIPALVIMLITVHTCKLQKVL